MKKLILILAAFIAVSVNAQNYEQVNKTTGFDTTIMTIHHEVRLNVCPTVTYKIAVVDTTYENDVRYDIIEFIPLDTAEISTNAERLNTIEAELTYLNSVITEYSNYADEPIESIRRLKENTYNQYKSELNTLLKEKEKLSIRNTILNIMLLDIEFMTGKNNDKNREHLKLFRKYNK